MKSLMSASRALAAAAVLSLGALLAACGDGPAEEAGETIDESADEAGDAVEDATE